MTYEVNTLVATIIKKEDAPAGSVGAVIGIKTDENPRNNEYLVELFTVKGHEHDQIWYKGSEIYKIQQ